jgi:NAD(P)-dependent dehydrogenase (short-subunit alcohol dehydrogenase family)
MKIEQGQVAVVTGAGSGIGQATAVLLASRGVVVALADINESGMAETARRIAKTGSHSSQHVVDVGNRKQMEAFARSVESAHQRVDIVINNAGIGILEDFVDNSLDEFQKVVDVNLWGVVYGAKLFLPLMRRQGSGHIVNISSLAGIISTPGMVSYGTTKYAVRGFSESLRIELAEYGIGVTSVHPGLIGTNILKVNRSADARLHERLIEWFDRWGRPPELVARKLVRGIERNRMRVLVTPETYVMDFAKRMVPATAERLSGFVLERIKLAGNPDYRADREKRRTAQRPDPAAAKRQTGS